MNNRLFASQQENSSLSLSDRLFNAIESRNSTVIDQLIKEKNQGAYLNLNTIYCRGGRVKPVELLLEKGDFTSAGKLIAAGADTVYTETSRRTDSDGYPETVTDYCSVFDKVIFSRNNFIEFVSGLLGIKVSELQNVRTEKNDYTLRDELQHALSNHNYLSAGKLIALGASTEIQSRQWVSDQNDCYPYGSFKNISYSVFRNNRMYPSDLRALAQGLTGLDFSAENKGNLTFKNHN